MAEAGSFRLVGYGSLCGRSSSCPQADGAPFEALVNEHQEAAVAALQTPAIDAQLDEGPRSPVWESGCRRRPAPA